MALGTSVVMSQAVGVHKDSWVARTVKDIVVWLENEPDMTFLDVF